MFCKNSTLSLLLLLVLTSISDAQDTTTAEGVLEQSSDGLEVRLDGMRAVSVADVIEVFKTTRSSEVRGISASALNCLAERTTVTQQMASESLQVRTLFQWIKLLRVRNGELLDDPTGATSQEKYLEKIVSFVDMVSKSLAVEYPSELRAIIRKGFSESNWEALFNQSKVKLYEELKGDDGLVSFENDDRTAPRSLMELADSRKVLFHTWTNDQLFVAFSASPLQSTNYAELVCLNLTGKILWRQQLSVWTDRVFRTGTFAFVRIAVSKDSKSIVVFSVFPNSFGIECLDVKSGLLTSSFFSCLPNLIPAVPGEG